DTGNAAITEAAIIAGCDVYAGYPITPSTEIAENMSRRLPQSGGWYLQTEDELAGLYACLGASLGGLKAMTSTSGPGYVLFSDPYGWGISSEIPVVIVDAQRVGPVSGITGAPGQGEFYLSRYPTHGGNFETIVLAPNSVQEAFDMTVRAFYLAERFRTPVTILADQIVTDGWESFVIPENDEELAQRGLETISRKINYGPDFFPPTSDIDVPPVVLGHNTGAACSDWTPTEEGYDIEDPVAHLKHSYRLVYKIRDHRELIDDHQEVFMDDDPDIVIVSYGSVSRVAISAVKAARERGIRAGALRLKSLWPFQDKLFGRKKGTKYLVAELNFEGQLVREVQRAAQDISGVHFFGKCGELPTVDELIGAMEDILSERKISAVRFVSEAW
ncbi:MAG: 2-oxoglutarate ferredoxin oxidoreductase subunit alpha, partial [Ruminiclostridium sp.]|nr:2-oxoglutarate ferredoxin oxidoreductase subunit alpha [Ruminiclostridium sp.]